MHPLSPEEWNAIVAESVAARRSTVVYSVNLHGLYLLERDERLRAAHARADLIRIDGMIVVGLGRMLGLPVQREHRLTWLDWIDPLCTLAERSGWSIYYLGAEPEVLDQGLVRLRDSYPRLRIGGHHGYFSVAPDSPENQRVIDDINRFAPDILIVGMGMPRQELWVDINRKSIRAPVILTAGACIEYIAGAVPTPPRWLGAIGMEWAFRFASNPRRFARRYLIEPWVIVPRVVLEAVRLRLGGRAR